jgi:hypothetical protein
LPVVKFANIYDIPLTPEYLTVTAVNACPDQVARLVRAIGPFYHGEDYFVPCLACDQRTQSGAFIPQSERVTFSNLRETVVSLSTPETSPQVREAFYAHNPIPGVQWRLENGSHILVNADEIMPANYDIPDYRWDIKEYVSMFAWLQTKIPKYVSVGELKYDGSGESSTLVSNFQEGLRLRDRLINQPLEE